MEESTSTEKNKKTSTIVASVVGVIVSLFISQFFFRAPSFDKQLIAAANELNKTCPIFVDRDTRLDNAVSPKADEFHYNYTLINLTESTIDPHLKDQMTPNLTNVVRTNPGMKIFRDNDVTVVYNYKDKDGVFLFRISISPRDYKE